MRRINLLFLLFMSLNIMAQNDTIDPEDKGAFMDRLFRNVDLSQANSGYLKNYYVGLRSLDDYFEIDNGQTQLSIPVHTPFSYLALEKVLKEMQIANSSNFRPFAQNLFSDHTRGQNSTEQHLGLAFIHYNKLHEDFNTLSQALTFNAFQYFDRPNRPFSPFGNGYVFSGSSARMVCENRVMTFQLDSDDLMTNVPANDLSIAIDFGDGSGYQNITLGHTYSVNYGSYGPKTIKYRVAYKNVSYLSTSVFLVKDPNFNSHNAGIVGNFIGAIGGYDSIPDDSFHVDYQGVGATAYIEYGCGHDKLVRPMILVNGFDFEDQVNFDYVMDQLSAEGMDAALEGNQMDLVFIDFEEGAGDMHINAELTRKVIEKVNELKEENLSEFDNEVMGFSMGGVLARMALREMELDGVDHETNNYISFDAPHKGANVPMAMQYLVRDLTHDIVDNGVIDLFFFEIELSDIVAIASLITGTDLSPSALLSDPNSGVDFMTLAMMANSPAAKQLLKYQLEPVTIPFLLPTSRYHTAAPAPEHQNFMNYLDGIGFPQNTHNITISNGNADGNGVKVVLPGDYLFFFKMQYDEVNLDGFIDIWGKALNYTTDFKTFYRARIFAHIKYWDLGGSATTTHNIYKRNALGAQMYSYDTAPGGLFELPAGPSDIDAGFAEIDMYPYVPTILKDRFCFVPATSSIASNQPNPYTSFDPTAITSSGTGESPFDVISTFSDYTISSPFYNERHITLSSDHSTVLADAILPSNLDYPSSSALYLDEKLNFGQGLTTVTRDYVYPFPVLNGGTLCVNCNDRIGFSSNTSNELAISSSHFDVETSIGCDYDGYVMTIHDGATIEIGDGNTRTGTLTIREHSTVLAKSGSTIRVRKGSKLIVDEGAKLIIEPNVTIILEDDNSVLEFHGKEALEIEDNATFTFTGSGNLYFDKDWDPTYPMSIVLGTNAKIDLQGSGEDDLVLEANRNFAVGGNSTNEFKVWYGKIWIAPNRNFSVSTPMDWRYDKVECSSMWERYKSVVFWGQDHTIRHTKFIRGGEGANEAAFQAHLFADQLKLQFCEFKDCTTGLRVFGERFSAVYCDFDDCKNGIVAKNMEGNSYILGGDFNNNDSGIDFSGQAGSELKVKKTDILNGDMGIAMEDSKLILECSKIDNMTYEGVLLASSVLVLNSEGKNIISNCDHGISCYDAENLYISDGYNTFSNNNDDIMGNFVNYSGLSIDFQYVHTGQAPVGHGTPNHYTLNMANNVISNAYSNIIDPTVRVSVDPGVQFPLLPINYQDNPTIPSCESRTHPGHIGELVLNPGVIGTIKKINTPRFPHTNMYHAVSTAVSHMTFVDRIGQNKNAVSMLAEILNNLPANMAREDLLVAEFAYQKMLEAVAYAYSEAEVARNPGTPAARLDVTLDLAIGVINSKVSSLNSSNNKEAQLISQLLMDKAQLFRTAGHFDYADAILSQGSNWLTSKMIDRATLWSCVVDAEEELVLRRVKFEEFLNLLNQCQSGAPRVRKISSSFSNSEAFTEALEPQSNFLLSPSASSSLIRLKVLNEQFESKLTFIVRNTMGRTVNTTRLQGLECNWNVSDWEKGVYLIEVLNEAKRLETLKIVVM